MENRITHLAEEAAETTNDRFKEAQAMSEILQELLAHYQAKYPGLHIAVVETPANAL